MLFFLFPCFILLLLTAIRGNGGDDFYVYEKYFNALPDEIFNYGYGYYSLNMFVKNFGEYPFFYYHFINNLHNSSGDFYLS